MKKATEILSNQQVYKDYLEGKLSKEEVNIVEKEMQNNPFFADAMEGFKNNPDALKILPKLAQKNSGNSSKYLGVTLSAAVVLTLAITWGVYSFYPKNKEELIVLKDVNEVGQPSDKSISIKAPTPIVELSDSAIDYSQLKKSDKQVSYTAIAQEQKEIQSDFDEDAKIDSSNVPEVPFEKLEHVQIEPIQPEEKTELVTESVPLISLHGLISVNYTKIDKGYTVSKQKIVLNGVPASLESKESAAEEPSHEIVVQKVPYHTYLKDVQFYFSKNKFKKALKGYKEILKQHPSDLNAHFYSAICYYNINQSQKALEHLKVVNEHQYDAFRQEGEWYTVLSLVDLKQYEKAKEELQKVINRKDFYYSQAIKLNEELKGK